MKYHCGFLTSVFTKDNIIVIALDVLYFVFILLILKNARLYGSNFVNLSKVGAYNGDKQIGNIY